MSYKKQLQIKNNYEHDSVQIQGPSNYEEIDALFNKYCREVSGLKSHEILSAKPSVKRNQSPSINGSKPNTALHRPSTVKNGSLDSDRSINKYLTNASLTNLQYTQRSEHHIKSDKKDQSKGGNNKEARVTHLQIMTPENEIAQMAKDFDIPPAALASLSTPKEKEEFVIEYIRKAVSDELKELTKKHSMKMYQSKKFEKDRQRMKDKAERDKADIFKWLNVPTEFDPLKKKLRAQIVNAINENANHEIVGKALDEISRSKDNINLSSVDKITLDNIPIVNNLELLGGVLEEDQSKMFKSTRSVKYSQNKEQNSGTSFIISNRGLTSPVLKTEPNRDKALTEREKNDEEKQDLYDWTQLREMIFSSHRADAKSRLFKQVKSSNWNDLGFSPLIQAYITNEKSKSERDTILKRYIDGDLLTAEEHKYIATTSTALNSHVDKKYLQKVVNNLDSDTINAIELNLAEAILKEYKRVRKEINDARQEHLREDNKKLIDSVQRKEEHFQKKIVIASNRAHQKKIKERIIGYLDKMEEKKKWRRPLSTKKNLDLQSEASLMRSFTSGSERFSKETEGLKTTPHTQAEFLRAFVRTPNPPKAFDLKLSQHYYHPSSKVYLQTDPQQQKDFFTLPVTYVDQKVNAPTEDPEDYKLHIHSHKLLKDKSLFKKYYSGGPKEHEHNIFQGNFIYGDVSQYKIKDYQFNVLIKIQAVWRGYRQRKRFKKQLENYREFKLQEEREREREESSRALNQTDIKVLSPRSIGQNPKDKISFSLRREDSASPARSSTFQDLDKRPISARYHKNGEFKVGSLIKHSFFQKADLENSQQNEIQNSRAKGQFIPKIGKLRPFTAQGQKLVTISTTRPTQETEGSVSNHRNDILTTKSSIYKPNKFGGNISKTVLTEGDGVKMDTRLVTISQRAPPKGLLLKQRKLFVAAKTNNMGAITASGFHYFETDVNAKDEHDNTPLFYSARHGNKEICDFLLGCGAKVNVPCSEGNTPLHMAFASNEVMVVILLISRGGNLNTLNNHGQTPLAFGSESLLHLLNLKSGVATFDTNGNRGDFDNNHLLSKSTVTKLPQEPIMFRYQPLEKTSIKVLDQDNSLHTFMSLKERNVQKLKH